MAVTDFDAAIIYAAGFVAAQGCGKVAEELLASAGIHPTGNHSGAAEYDLNLLRTHVVGWENYAPPNMISTTSPVRESGDLSNNAEKAE